MRGCVMCLMAASAAPRNWHERATRMNDERDSQLSAMFDNELAAPECELLARRLSRDPQLQRHWASYALIGAALRHEPVRARSLASVVRDGKGQVAERVRSALHEARRRPAQQHTGVDGDVWQAAAPWRRALAGAGIAAGVAALSIIMLRQQAAESVAITANATVPHSTTTIVLPGPAMARTQMVAQSLSAQTAASQREPESYTVPSTSNDGLGIASAQLANYVVAHSEYSGPLARRNLLAALIASEAPAAPADAGNAVPPADSAPSAAAQPVVAGAAGPRSTAPQSTAAQ